MIGIAKGMILTFKHLFRPAITIQYPNERRTLPERSRMSFAILTDETGAPQCKACMLCQKSCPDDAIHIESEKREDGPGRVLTSFTIDLGRCMYCGICVEQCTTQGLVHTSVFETCTPERSGTIAVLFTADKPASPPASAPHDHEAVRVLVPAEEGAQ